MAFMFEKSEVYQKAVTFADQIAAITAAFPRGYGFLADQLNRAALSIAANLAGGNGRFTKADRRHFFTIARGSIQECVPLLEVARRRNLLAESAHQVLLPELEAMAKMISGLIKGLENRQSHVNPASSTNRNRTLAGRPFLCAWQNRQSRLMGSMSA